jgi:hypothetical protein
MKPSGQPFDAKAAAEKIVAETYGTETTRFNSPVRFTSSSPDIGADDAEQAIINAGFHVFHRSNSLVEPIIEQVPTYGGVDPDRNFTQFREGTIN